MRLVAIVSALLLLVLLVPARAEDPPGGDRTIIVALGASNTAGKGVRESEAYPAQLESLLRAEGFAVTVLNAGINGNTTDQMLGRLDHAVPEGTRIVILQPGGNDKRKGFGPLRADNITEIERRLAARKIEVVMLDDRSLAPLPHQNDGQHLTADGYRRLAKIVLPDVVASLRKIGQPTRE